MTPPPRISTDDLLAHAGWVRALARRLARDAASADDLAQGALNAALARPPEPGRPLRPWLARVVANLARKQERGAARRLERERAAARPDETRATDVLLEELEEQQRLARLVAGLPEPYRTVVLRRYYRGDSAASIARDHGVATATIRSQLARGLARLRAQIERRCDGDRQRALGVLAFAAGGRERHLTETLLTTTSLLAMNTGTKLAALAVTAATVCVGTLILMSLPGAGEDVHPKGAPVPVAPAAATRAPAADDQDELHGAEEEQRVAVRRAGEEPVEAAQTEEEAAPSGHVVFARAIDESGLPIAGAQLVPTTEEGMARAMPASAPSAVDGRIELELDRKACFQYAGRENANAFLSLRAPGYATEFFVGIVTLHGRHDQGDRVLAPGGAVSGLVTDPFGGPVIGATVVATSALVDGDPSGARWAGPEIEGGRPSAMTDASGRFEIGGAHVGPTRIWANADGFLWSYSDVVDVQAAALAEGIELALEPLPDEARIAGTVVDAEGIPVEGAQVTYRTPRNYDEQELLTDAAGRFSIALEARQNYVLTTHDPRGRHGPAQPLQASPGQTDLTIELTPRRMLAVRALGPEGQPLEDVGVIAIIVDDEDDYMNQSWSHTDSAGRVEVPARAAPFRVSFSEPGYESLELGPFDPEALPEGEVVGQLVREPSVRGVVLHEGEPVAGASVELMQTLPNDSRLMAKGFPARLWSSGGLDDVRSDAEGRFSVGISGNERLQFVLVVEKEGLALQEHPLESPAKGEEFDEVEVHLGVGGALTGQVHMPLNRSHAGVVIGASRGDGRPRFTRTDAEGRYRFEHLTPGPWRVEDRVSEPEGRVHSIRSEEEAPFDWNCEIREGDVTVLDVDLRWQEDLRVRGRLVLDQVGAVGWSAIVEAPRGADREFHLQPAPMDEEGRFAAEALPGRAELVLTSPPGESPVRRLISEIDVTADLQPFDLAMKTGAMAGRIDTGRARMRVHHRIDPNTHLEAEFATDEEGAFEISGLPAGKLSLQREQNGDHGLGWYPYKTVEIRAGETATIY